MQVIVVDDYEALSALAAGLVAGFLWARPDATLALPTGATPEGFYRALVATGVSFARVRTFNLDEYRGLPREHPGSFYHYMKTRLFDHVDLPPEHRFVLDGTTADPDAECRRYEEAIRQAGGIDLAVLGLGLNGHIGFNEPGTPWDSRTRLVTLAETTRRANARFFGGPEGVPREALTMGIGTILEARRILVLVSGEGKAAIVRRFLEGPVTPEVPATALRNHPHVTVILDRAAAGQLTGTPPVWSAGTWA